MQKGLLLLFRENNIIASGTISFWYQSYDMLQEDIKFEFWMPWMKYYTCDYEVFNSIVWTVLGLD